jgi:hypothetical protein
VHRGATPEASACTPAAHRRSVRLPAAGGAAPPAHATHAPDQKNKEEKGKHGSTFDRCGQDAVHASVHAEVARCHIIRPNLRVDRGPEVALDALRVLDRIAQAGRHCASSKGLAVAGAAALCVPERLFPAPHVAHCVWIFTTMIS